MQCSLLNQFARDSAVLTRAVLILRVQQQQQCHLKQNILTAASSMVVMMKMTTMIIIIQRELVELSKDFLHHEGEYDEDGLHQCDDDEVDNNDNTNGVS